MRFSFRLQALLNWKKNLEHLSQILLAERMEGLKNQEAAIEKLRRERAESDRRLASELTRGMTVEAYLSYKEFEESTLGDLLRKEEEKELILREIEKRREELIGFMKETKVLDELREKNLKKFNRHMEKVDQQFIDEIVALKHPVSPHPKGKI